MLRLFKVSVSTDWKGRPSHELTDLGTGTREELIRRMNKDVLEWQKKDLDGAPAGTPWEDEDKWESELRDPEPGEVRSILREFAEDDDGEFSSIAYHILDIK